MCDGVSTRVFLLVSTHWFVNMSKEVGASHGDDSSEFALGLRSAPLMMRAQMELVLTVL
jgi:hypothetical protein